MIHMSSTVLETCSIELMITGEDRQIKINAIRYTRHCVESLYRPQSGQANGVSG